MGACETTPATHRAPGEPASDPRTTARTATAVSSLPSVGRRLPASRSFVLARACRRGAAGAPALTPARRHTPATARKSRNYSLGPTRQPAPQVTGPTQHALLTTEVPMGAATGPSTTPSDETRLHGNAEVQDPEFLDPRRAMALPRVTSRTAAAGLGTTSTYPPDLRPRFAATPEALAAAVQACRDTHAQRHVLLVVYGWPMSTEC